MTVTAIELSTSDNVTLRGQLWNAGDDWIICIHDAEQDLDCWKPLIHPLLNRGYTILTIDLRGHGASDGQRAEETVETDIAVTLRFARQQGAVTRFVIADGLSAIASLAAVTVERPNGLVLLSPHPMPPYDLKNMRGEGVSKLLLAGSRDEEASATVRQLRNTSTGWTLVVQIPTAESGTDLFGGRWKKHVREYIVKFLQEQRYLASRATTSSQRSIPSPEFFRKHVLGL